MIDWGRVPEKTLVKHFAGEGDYCIEFFIAYCGNEKTIEAGTWLSDTAGNEENASEFELLLPEDIEKYTIKEEEKYVCPNVWGGS